MSRVDLTEPFAIRTARKAVRESMQMHGEEIIGLHMYHPVIDQDVERCPNCYDEDYKQGDPQSCTVCYGTTFNGGIKVMARMWAMFDDAPNVEEQTKRGVWQPGDRGIQIESHPIFMEHDYFFRVKRWSQDHRPLEMGDAFTVDAVTVNSLRTGNQVAQNTDDVVGQKCRAHQLDVSHIIYKVKGRVISDSFPVDRLDGMPR